MREDTQQYSLKGSELRFEKQVVTAELQSPEGRPVEHCIELRTNPITGRKSRITLSRQQEREPGTEVFPQPPPSATQTGECPFCHPQVEERTPRLSPRLSTKARLVRGESILFPNLFPYGQYSAISLIGGGHFVEIGSGSAGAYAECLQNCLDYLNRVRAHDDQAVYLAITQNHLPSAGGSLVHPHLQIQAETTPCNNMAFLEQRCSVFHAQTNDLLFSEYLSLEKRFDKRYIGKSGDWEWLTAFAPEGFFEIWAVLPGHCSLSQLDHRQISSLAQGIIQAQRFYRSLNRNGYNLGLTAVEQPGTRMELRLVMLARSNYAPWVRNDHTGFEVMLGDMATFTPPEETAAKARVFWT